MRKFLKEVAIFACGLLVGFCIVRTLPSVSAQEQPLPGTEKRLPYSEVTEVRIRQLLSCIEQMRVDVAVTRATVTNIENRQVRWERLVAPLIERRIPDEKEE